MHQGWCRTPTGPTTAPLQTRVQIQPGLFNEVIQKGLINDDLGSQSRSILLKRMRWCRGLEKLHTTAAFRFTVKSATSCHFSKGLSGVSGPPRNLPMNILIRWDVDWQQFWPIKIHKSKKKNEILKFMMKICSHLYDLLCVWFNQTNKIISMH